MTKRRPAPDPLQSLLQLQRRVGILEQQVKIHTGRGHKATGARVYLNAATQSIPDSTYTAIAFDTVDLDSDGFWNVGNPARLTVPVGSGLSGQYVVLGGVQFVGASGGVSRRARLEKNGAAMYGGLNFVSVPGAALASVPASAWPTLAEGDYVSLFVWQDSGGALNANGATSDSTWMAMFYLGA